VVSFLLAQGRCLAARDFRKRSRKCDFLVVPSAGNAFFPSEHRKFMKMDRGKLETPQIDPRGFDGAGLFAIRSYGVGHEGQKLDILM
jgi:hypothetical protein